MSTALDDLTRVVNGRPVPALRMAPYGRVSQDRDGNRKSVDDQLADYDEDRDEHPEWDERDRYLDNNLSASEFATKDRPEFMRLIADVTAGRINAIWLWEPSRLTRDMEMWGGLRKLLQKMGVQIWVHTHARLFDFNNRRHAQEFTKLILESEDESLKIHERVSRGVKSNLRTGKPHGKTPYGYRRNYDPHSGAFIEQIPDPETGPIVQEIFMRVSTGEARRRIALDLTRRGIPTPSQWRGAKKQAEEWLATTITNIVGRVVYIGLREYDGKSKKLSRDTRPGDWPALVTVELFEQCQQQIGTYDKGDEDKPVVLESVAKYLLSQIMTCADCGAKTQRGLKRNGTQMYYCSKAGHVRCDLAPADDFVLMEISNYLRRAVNETGFDLSPDLGVRMIAAREAVASAQAERERYRAALRAGSIDLADYELAKPRLERAVTEAEDEVHRLSVPAPLRALLREGDPGERFVSAPLAAQRQILREMFAITLHKTGRKFDPEKHIEIKLIPR